MGCNFRAIFIENDIGQEALVSFDQTAADKGNCEFHGT